MHTVSFDGGGCACFSAGLEMVGVGGWMGVADGMLVRCFLWYLGVVVRWSGKKDGMGWCGCFGLGWFELSCLISLTTLENSIPPLCMSGFFFVIL